MELSDEQKQARLTAGDLQPIIEALTERLDDQNAAAVTLAIALIRKGVLTEDEVQTEAKNMLKLIDITAESESHKTLSLLSRISLREPE